VAAAAVGVLVVGAAIVNSRRAAHDAHRLAVLPAPTASAPRPEPANIFGLQCNDFPGKGTSEDARVKFATAIHPDLDVVAIRCADASGERHPSLVHVIDNSDDHRIIATLVRPQQYLHVLALAVDGLSITVTASEAAPVASGDQKAASDLGSVFTRRFTTVYGENFTQSEPQRVAFACSPADLRLSLAAVTPSPAGPGATVATAGTLRFTNTSTRTCAIEGYPTVTGSVGTANLGAPVTAHRELIGPSGRGVRDATAPPVILLAPGSTVSAAVDSADQTPAGGTALCSTLVQLRVGLPTGEPLGVVSGGLRVCDFQVHPIVEGTTGTTA
jgi:hypothetical protein